MDLEESTRIGRPQGLRDEGAVYPGPQTQPANPEAALYGTFTWADVDFRCIFVIFIIIIICKKGFFKSRNFLSEEGLNWEPPSATIPNLPTQVARFVFPAGRGGTG